MSVKLIENLPSKDLPWFRRYTRGDISSMIQPIFKKDGIYKQHFGFNIGECMVSSIAVANIQTIDLLRINECGFMNLAYLKGQAHKLILELDTQWDIIKNHPEWNFYYINKDSGLSKDVYHILNTIMAHPIVG